MVRWLLGHGANVNIIGRGKTSGTALSRAARFGHVGCVEVLLAGGADLGMSDGDGVTAVGHALAFDHVSVVCALVCAAAALGGGGTIESTIDVAGTIGGGRAGRSRVEVLQPHLGGAALQVTERPGGRAVEVPLPHLGAAAGAQTALHVCAQWGSVRCLAYLLQGHTHGDNHGHGHSHSQGNDHGRDHSLDRSHSQGSEGGLDHDGRSHSQGHSQGGGFDGTPCPSPAVVNAAAADGTTALHLAARWGHVGAVRLLLGAGAQRGCMDAAGHTPAAMARKWGRTVCASLLEEEAWVGEGEIQGEGTACASLLEEES